MITELCAVLSFSAIQNNDKVGVIFFSDKIEKYIPPKKGRSHILRIIREMLDIKPEHKQTNLAQALQFFNNVIKKKAITFVLSDFMCGDFENALKLAKKRHDIVGIHVYDQREKELPNVGLARVLDAESGQTVWLDTSIKEIRHNYNKWYVENHQRVITSFIKSGADIFSIATNESYVKALMKFFKKRM